MSTPPDPQQGQPYPGQQPQGTPQPYGTGYGGAQYPYPGGQGLAPGQQPQGYPYNPYAQPSPYGQSPYGGGPYPAGLDKAAAPAVRPGIMVLGLVLMILAALPFLAFGVLFLVVPLDSTTIPPEVFNNPQLAEAGVTAETLISILRIFGGVFVVLALLYIAFAVLAFLGRNWSRILVTVMTVGFSLFLLLGAVSGGAADAASMGILLAPVVLAVAGVATMFVPAARQYFAAPRR
ncbi:hypothetical protein ACVGOW_31630 [Pseudonocardia saturnea]